MDEFVEIIPEVTLFSWRVKSSFQLAAVPDMCLLGYGGAEKWEELWSMATKPSEKAAGQK